MECTLCESRRQSGRTAKLFSDCREGCESPICEKICEDDGENRRSKRYSPQLSPFPYLVSRNRLCQSGRNRVAAVKHRSNGFEQGRNYNRHQEVTSRRCHSHRDTSALPGFGVEWTLSSILVIIRVFFSNSPVCSRILCMKGHCVNL